MRTRRVVCGVIVVTLVAALPWRAQAETSGDGALVSSYGDHGVLRYDGGRDRDYPEGLLVDSLGRAVVVTVSGVDEPPTWVNGGGDEFTPTIERLLPTGQPDTSFGVGGIVRIFDPQGERYAHMGPIVLTADGGMDVLVRSSTDGNQYIGHLRSDGSLDPAYGVRGDGWTPLPTPLPGASAESMTLTPSGGMLIAGVGQPSQLVRSEVYLLALDASLQVDTTFGSQGVVLRPDAEHPETINVGIIPLAPGHYLLVEDRWRVQTGMSPGVLESIDSQGVLDPAFGTAGQVRVADVAPAPPGTYYLTGATRHPSGAITVFGVFGLVRYLSNGQPDPGFDRFLAQASMGGLPTSVATDGEDVVVLPNGVLPSPGGSPIRLRRVHPDGSLDLGFGTNGNVNGSVLRYDQAVGIAVRPHAAAGSSPVFALAASGPEDPGIDVGIAAFDAAGLPDASFGTNGTAVFDLSQSGPDETHTAALDSAGRLVIAGRNDVAFVSRRLANGAPDVTFGAGGSVSLLDMLQVDAVVPTSGGVVVVGHRTTTRLVLRLTDTGAIDPTFAGGSLELTPPTYYASQNASAAALADGRLVISEGGRVWILSSNGALDPSVGNGGVLDLDFVSATRVVARGSGFLIAGIDCCSPPNQQVKVEAQLVPGTVDPSFGIGGTALVSSPGVPPNYQALSGLQLTPTGIAITTSDHLVHLGPNGLPDPTFNAPNLPGAAGSSVDATGRTLVLDAAVVSQATLERYSATGALDPSFGDAGRLVVSAGVSRFFGGVGILVSGTRVLTYGTSVAYDHRGTDTDVTVIAVDEALGDSVPTLNIDDVTGYEVQGAVEVTAHLNRPATTDVAISYELVSGTANVPDDGGTTFGPHQTTIRAGESSVDIWVLLADDTLMEGNEQMTVHIVDAQQAAVADADATVTIVDDPRPRANAVTPSDGIAGTTFPMTIDGTHFSPGTTVSFSAAGATASNVTVISPTRIQLNVALNPGTTPGDGTVIVADSDGTTSAQFIVTPADQVQRFVTSSYLNVLGRLPDPGGFDYWADRIYSGTPRPAVADALYSSLEVRREIAAYLFAVHLHRQPDPGGLQYFADQLLTRTIESIQIEFTASNEYFASRGGNNTDQLITAVYNDVLNRNPDPGGLTYWHNQLASGQPRSAVASSIIFSNEAVGIQVDAGYSRLLGRGTEPGGRAYWIQQIQTGLRLEHFLALLIGSPEYFARV